MPTDAQVLDEVQTKPVEEVPLELAHSEEPEEIHMPPSTIAPLIVGVGIGLALLGMIAPLLGVIGLVIAVVGGLRMAQFPEIDLHSSWLTQLNNRKFGMWAFISSEVMFFTSLIGGFVAFKTKHPDEFAEAHEILSLPLATLGTSVLIISSFAVVMALEALQSNSRRVFYNWVGLTVLFGASFLSIQAFEWYELMHEGIEAADVFGTVFFVTTGFHGLHVLGGVAWLSILLLRSLRGYYSAENYLGIELFGLYWHFVDVVWIVLFTVIYLIH
ncbi:MAG: cytochrome c oxidase subunit 3 [Chloroflexi bacterium]|nr:cytochrome c oxidase subunit 3 [Chloroflexota bacterium]